MKVSALLLQLMIALSLVSTLAGQRFPCNGELLMSTTNTMATTISRPVFIPFVAPFLSPIARYHNVSFDALGFNSKDNFIYAVEENTNAIVRLKQDNTFEQVGVVSLVDTLKTFAGDCTPEGLYLCYEEQLNQILVFEVTDGFQLLNRIDLFWDPSSSNAGAFSTRIFDFAIDPNNPLVAYTYQATFETEELSPVETRGQMLQINLNFDDPNLGMITPIEQLNPFAITHIGALIFGPRSDLYGFGSNSDGLNPLQNRLISINPFAGEISQILLNNPASILSDGCSCPFSFTFSLFVPTEGQYCNNDLKNYVLTIDNNSFNSVSDVTLLDTFPEGMIIEGISNNVQGNIVSGIGENILEVTELFIPAKTRLEIIIKVRSIDAKIGPTYNQAFLSNLPPRLGGVMPSDDLATVLLAEDSSCYYVTPRRLEDATWELTPPTDCLEANDGMIVLTSPQFFPGQEFEVNLRNKIGWEESSHLVVIDENNSFTVDSLIPGNYILFDLRALSGNCSLAIKDTTIILEAPNDLLSLDLSSNAPICEGEILQLNSEVSPAGDMQWSGPKSFGSEDYNPMLENTDPDRSGEYRATLEYGYCTLVKYLEVDIKPQVNSFIEGDTSYCAREPLSLMAFGEGGNLQHEWTTPDDQLMFDSILHIPSLHSDQSGYYEVITTNGACIDTVGIDILVLPTPTLSLDNLILADFCAPIILKPELTGDTEVTYEWTPQDGLDCSDCPNPQILPIVQSSYQLIVENDYFCSDSAAVDIVLDKDKIVYAPNIFRPNGTSGNNRFAVFPGCVVRHVHSLDIYDRWGNKVFQSLPDSPDDPLDIWNGLIHGKKNNSGVYIWFAKVELVDGTVELLTGDVTLVEERP